MLRPLDLTPQQRNATDVNDPSIADFKRKEMTMRLGIVVERRKLDNPWVDHSWKPVAVVPGLGEVEAWRLMEEGPDWARFGPTSMKTRQPAAYAFSTSLMNSTGLATWRANVARIHSTVSSPGASG